MSPKVSAMQTATPKPLGETVRATLDEASTTDEAGLSAPRERELLEAWKAQAPAS